MELLQRPRRNRKTPAIRTLVAENTLRLSDLVAPFFLIEGEGQREPIKSLPGIDRLTVDLLLQQAELLHKKGIQAVALFPVIPLNQKDETGSAGFAEESLMVRAIKALKLKLPTLCIIADIALDPFTTHGHDGILNENGDVANDPTVSLLVLQALRYAEAGVDLVAPSDMMDGRVGEIRRALDRKGFQETGILAYTAKYASSFYSPFREALRSFLKEGNKKTYQMDPANSREALREAKLDLEEGADMLMVKPALPYLDVISKMREHVTVPLCAFHVSGEYAMVMAAHQLGYLDADAVFKEILLSIKRAGADFIISYATERMSHLL